MAGAGRLHGVLLAAACGVVAGGVAWHGMALARAGCCYPPDAVEYVATAHSWLEGAGFVDPILYTYYLPDVHPPVPAFAVRPPGLSVLLVPVLALGADLDAVLVWHVAWSAAIAAAALLVARRRMSLPAATGFAIAATWSPVWLVLSPMPLSEISSIGVLVAFLALLRRGTASVPGGLLLALLTLVGWMVRPNLGLVLPAVVLAVACERGPRAALRQRPLWAYVVGFVLLHRAVVLAVTAATGFEPYAHYGAMLEIVRPEEIFQYGKEYVGWQAYLGANLGAVLASVGRNAGLMVRVLFEEDYFLWAGWLVTPGVVLALWLPGSGSLERRFAAFAALGFTLVAIATYGGFDELRYPLPGVVCGWYATLSALDAAAERWAGSRRWRTALHGLPLLVVVALYGLQNGAGALWFDCWGWRAAGERYAAFCGRVDPDALVASLDPWKFHLACGNAGYRIPDDLWRDDTLDRYLDERRPGYLLLHGGRRWAFLEQSSRLEKLAVSNRLELFRVLDPAPPLRPWRAPPPLLRRPTPESPGH